MTATFIGLRLNGRDSYFTFFIIFNANAERDSDPSRIREIVFYLSPELSNAEYNKCYKQSLSGLKFCRENTSGQQSAYDN